MSLFIASKLEKPNKLFTNYCSLLYTWLRLSVFIYFCAKINIVNFVHRLTMKRKMKELRARRMVSVY